MSYRKLSIEELNKYPYPNLIAEWVASNYSICTLGEYMGLPGRRQEDDPEIMDRLHGRAEILASEAVGLSRLFGVTLEYLFSDKLLLCGDKPEAYIRWKRKDDALKKRSGKMKAPYELVSELEDILFKYERLEALISLMQITVDQAAETAGLPENCLRHSLFEIELGMEDNNNRLKKIVMGSPAEEETAAEQKGA